MKWKRNDVRRAAFSAAGYQIGEEPDVAISCIDPEDGEMALLVNDRRCITGILPSTDGEDVRDAVIAALAQRYA